MVNKIILLGNVGRIDFRAAGMVSVASVSLATNERWKDKDGNQHEKTDWHEAEAWGKLHDLIEKFVHVGDRIYIEGKLVYDSWETDAGEKRKKAKIRALNITLLGGSRKADEPEETQGSRGHEPARNSEQQHKNQLAEQLRTFNPPTPAGADRLPF